VTPGTLQTPPGRTIFLDTSAWFAALSPRDRWHADALRIYREATRSGATFLTTTFVLAEMHALLLRWRDTAIGRRFLDTSLDTPAHAIVSPDLDLVREAIDRWIGGFADQSFSLCDAVSFEIMRRERVSHALAFDRRFDVAGFQVVR
jgi:predicted nucleic acid-binding protein